MLHDHMYLKMKSFAESWNKTMYTQKVFILHWVILALLTQVIIG